MQADTRVYELESDIHQAMAHPKRLEIIHNLVQGEMGTSALAREIEVSMPNLSQHLSQLKQQGLIESRKDGLNIYYRLSSDLVLKAYLSVREILTQYLTQQTALLQQMAPAEDANESMETKDSAHHKL